MSETREYRQDVAGKGSQRWDHWMTRKTGRVQQDTVHQDPHAYLGREMRCHFSSWGAGGRTVRVRVEWVSKSGLTALVTELSGRMEGRTTRVQVCNLMEDKNDCAVPAAREFLARVKP